MVLNSCWLIHTVLVKVQSLAMGANYADGSILPADSAPVSPSRGPVSAAGILHFAQVRVFPHTRTAGKPEDSTACQDQCSHQTPDSVEMGSRAVHVSTNRNTTSIPAHCCVVYHCRGVPLTCVTKQKQLVTFGTTCTPPSKLLPFLTLVAFSRTTH
jgi:hypothetical protein